jgi:transposase
VTVYSETFRTKLVQKMLMPNARPVSVLAREAGVPEGTLFRWKKETTLGGMSADRPDDKTPSPTKPPPQWSSEEKLAVVLEAAAVPEAELGAFLRARGSTPRSSPSGGSRCSPDSTAAAARPTGRPRRWRRAG